MRNVYKRRGFKMKNTPTNHLNIVIIADVDLSRLGGDTCRIMAFASELKNNGMEVTIVAPKPINNEIMVDTHDINLAYIAVKQRGGSIINLFKRTRALIKKAKELQKKNTIFLIEMSSVGGYFAIAGFSGYVLDVHGIVFDEISYATLPWYIPKNFYRRYIAFLEKVAVKRAAKVITVSEAMAEFIANEWKVQKDKISIIPNGYFASQVANVTEKRINDSKGMVTFVGLLAKWASVDKIIRVASLLKNEKATFYIVGDGPHIYRQELEELVHSYGLTNVVFTGSVPLEKAYEMIARSEVVLSPLENSLSKIVCCPIKVLEYMAFGKAMVIDEVSDLSKYLKEKDAALVCDPENEEKFAENIQLLLKDTDLRKRIGANAKRLAEDYSWEKQGKKLGKVLEEVYKDESRI
jgi:glycosyltransferase involved in cell wall biosynthesis